MRLRNKIQYIIIIVSIIWGCYTTSITLNNSYIGVEINKLSDNTIIIENVYESGWAYKNNILEGDLVVSINGNAPKEHKPLQKQNKLEQIENLTIKRNQAVTEYTVKNDWTIKDIFYYILSPNIFLSLCLILSFVLIQRQELKKSVYWLIYFLVIIGISYSSAPASSRGDLWAGTITNFTFLLSPILFLKFYIEFLKELKITLKIKLPLRLCIIFIAGVSTAEIINNMLELHYSFIGKFHLFFVSGMMIINVILLISTYFKSKQTDAEATLKILMVGIIISFFPFVFVYTVPYVLFETRLIDAELAAMFIIFMPITFMYLISSNRLFDIDFFYHRYKQSFLFSIITTTLILMISIVLQVELQGKLTFIIFIVTLVGFLIKESFSIRNELANSLSTVDFYQQLYHFFQKAEKEQTTEHLLAYIKKEIELVIPRITTVTFLKQERDKNDVLAQKQEKIGTIINLPEGFYVLLDMKQQYNLYIFCSHKNNGTNLNPLEKTWLETMAQYSNVLLANLYLMEELVEELTSLKNGDKIHSQSLARLLFSISEKERVRLARDLHDTILQELIIINRMLDALQNEKDIKQVKENVLACIETTRLTCNELHPVFLMKLGLLESIKYLVKNVQTQSNLHIQFDTEFYISNLQPDFLTMVYRIIQELLSNAVKHAQATTIKLQLISIAEYIEIHYVDNGIGLQMIDLEKHPLHYSGLSMMKENIESYNGEFLILSEKGLRIFISIPYMNQFHKSHIPHF